MTRMPANYTKAQMAVRERRIAAAKEARAKKYPNSFLGQIERELDERDRDRRRERREAKQRPLKARRLPLSETQEDAAAELVTALVALINDTECYCVKGSEGAAKGICAHCQGKQAIARAAVTGIVVIEDGGA